MDINTFPQMLRELMLRERPFVAPCSSYYEAASLIRASLENFWSTTKERPSFRDEQEALDELLDIAVHCWRIAEDLELVHSDSADDEIRQELHTTRQNKIKDKLQQIYESMLFHGKPLPTMQKGRKPMLGFEYTEETLKEIKDILDYKD